MAVPLLEWGLPVWQMRPLTPSWSGRVQKGDKGAFDLLVLKYQHKIVNLVMRYVRDPDLALDITQEAFLESLSRVAKIQGR